MVPDMRPVQRARSQDLNKPMAYQVAFTRNTQGQVVYDRAFNTAALVSVYYGRPPEDFLPRIDWNIDDPNVLLLDMPGGLAIRTRVTRRSQSDVGSDRLETSEYIEQIFDSSAMNESEGPGPRLKASQVFTKMKWRPAAPGQVGIVATQVVGDFITGVDSGSEAKYFRALNQPVVTYTYRIQFARATA